MFRCCWCGWNKIYSNFSWFNFNIIGLVSLFLHFKHTVFDLDGHSWPLRRENKYIIVLGLLVISIAMRLYIPWCIAMSPIGLVYVKYILVPSTEPWGTRSLYPTGTHVMQNSQSQPIMTSYLDITGSTPNLRHLYQMCSSSAVAIESGQGWYMLSRDLSWWAPQKGLLSYSPRMSVCTLISAVSMGMKSAVGTWRLLAHRWIPWHYPHQYYKTQTQIWHLLIVADILFVQTWLPNEWSGNCMFDRASELWVC